MSDVYLNNKFVGTVSNGKDYAKKLIAERRLGNANSNMNVKYNPQEDEVLVHTDSSRSVRPLIVVKDGKSMLTKKHIEQLEKNEINWSDLLKQGIVEYVDALEEDNALIAFEESDITKNHTHLEVSPVGIFGLITSLVPYGNYTQGARLLQGSKNQKQGVGFYAANYYTRMDMDVSLLHYPQKPIVGTMMDKYLHYDQHPSGMNVTLAIMSYEGYNMEDAIIVNSGSMDRGFARSTYFRPIVAEEMRYSGGLIDEISIPDKEVKGYRSEHDYRFLEEDGIIYPEAKVAESDVIIGKSSPPRFLSSMDDYNLADNSRRESSMSLKHGEEGIIDHIMLTENNEGNKLIQVRIRDSRIPQIGDKFTSRHGQKGVISLVVKESDMPFSENGIKPDIIFSPFGIPSRMTVSHMLELLAGKVGALSGRSINATAFEGEKEADLREELSSYGLRDDGTEEMYDGISGKKYSARIFVGNIYYLKLKHMVANKLHSRARGPIQLLTRQPTEGRAKEGGLRLGEMEKDTLIAHGTSLLLKERFDSDKVIVPVCEGSGLVGHYDSRKNNRPISPLHGEDADLTNIEMSYAFKLLLDELKSLTLYPKLKLEPKF